MLKLRRATVIDAQETEGPEQSLRVRLEGGEGVPRAAIADTSLVGPAQVGDEVIVNVQALDLGLGSGGFDVVHVNVSRGLAGEGSEGAEVMKLNYTSLQHAVVPLERNAQALTLDRDDGELQARVVEHHHLRPLAALAGEPP